jgi:hypothetical protein
MNRTMGATLAEIMKATGWATAQTWRKHVGKTRCL